MSRAWTKDIKLDPGTFGGSPACHILVDMMNHDLIPIYEKHRVLSLINSIIVEFKAIATIKSAERRDVRETVMLRSRDFYLERIKKMAYPLIFRTVLMNVVHYKCKKFLKEAVQTVAGK